MKKHDEYIWSEYTKEYTAQLKEVGKEHDFFMPSNNLHPNWKELYKVVKKLSPKSIYECGCGGCYHLKNIDYMLPHSIVAGCDLLQSQLDFGRKFSELSDKLVTKVKDMTGLIDVKMQYEFVFTHSVVMHLSTQNAIAFMENMDRLSTKYIFMVEGTTNHETFPQMIKDVFTEDEWEFSMPNHYINNAFLLTKK